MLIQSSVPEPRIVTDYDITYTNGLFLSITVDPEVGDTVDWSTSPTVVIFNLSEKPSPTDVKAKLPAEEITVFMAHVLSIQKRTRNYTPPSYEQKEEFKRLVAEFSSSTVH